jgi:hypothetical protein
MFIAIPFDHVRKKKAMMQKANVSHGNTMMDEVVRRELYCICRLWLLYKGQVVYSEVPMSMERKKGMKKQRRSKK